MRSACVLLFSIALAGAQDAAPEKSAPDSQSLLRTFLGHVAVSDRSLAAAQTAIMKSAASARQDFEKAALLMRAPREQAKQYVAAAVGLVAHGITGLLGALGQAEQSFAAAGKSLTEAQKVQAPVDRALGEELKTLEKDMAAADRDIEAQRKRVQAQWNHYRSPRLARNQPALRGARVRLGNMMADAAAAWQEREVKRAHAKGKEDRRRRLAIASRAVARRLLEVRDLRQRTEQFRTALWRPLDGQRPRAALDKPQAWPDPLLKTMVALQEKVVPPRPFKPPSHWDLEHRVRRFLTGGSP